MTSGTDPQGNPAVGEAIARAQARVVAGRACGTCTLCCKVIAVVDFDKPPGVWCPHCVRGKGCGIYETRPTDCRTFFCEWMLTTSLGPEWKPERSKFALVMGEVPRLRDDAHGYGPNGAGFQAHVDVPPEVEAAYDALLAAHPQWGRPAR